MTEEKLIENEVFGEWRVTPHWFGTWPLTLDWTPNPVTRRVVLYLPGTGRGMTIYLHPVWVWLHGPAAWRKYKADGEPIR